MFDCGTVPNVHKSLLVMSAMLVCFFPADDVDRYRPKLNYGSTGDDKTEKATGTVKALSLERKKMVCFTSMLPSVNISHSSLKQHMLTRDYNVSTKQDTND